MRLQITLFFLVCGLCAFSQAPKSVPPYFDSTLTQPPVSIDKAKLYLKKGQEENALWVAIVNAADYREEANRIVKEIKKGKSDSTFVVLIENSFYAYASYIHRFIFQSEKELRNIDYYDMRKNELIAEVTENGEKALELHREALLTMMFNPAEARRILKRANEFIPNARRFAQIGELYEMEFDYMHAGFFYGKAINLNPHVEYYFRRGTVRGLDKNYSGAREDFTVVIDFNYSPLLRDSYTRRGEAYIRFKLFQEAVDDFTKALEIEEDYLVYFIRGRAYFFWEKYENAKLDFLKAIELNPKDVESYELLCYTLDTFEEKLETINKALEIDPDYADGYDYKGHIYYDQGLYEESCKNFKIAHKKGHPKALKYMEILKCDDK